MTVSKIFISCLVNFCTGSALRAARSAHAHCAAARFAGCFVLVFLRNLRVKMQSNDLRNGRLRRERIGEVSDAF